jgi:hypothetical protein
VVASAVGDRASVEVFAGAGCEQAASDQARTAAATSAGTRPAWLRGLVNLADGARTARCGPARGGQR